MYYTLSKLIYLLFPKTWNCGPKGKHLEEVIRRRYKAGLENLSTYQKALDSWVLLDGNSTELEKIAQG
jgi:hypothetical protein